MASNKNYRVPLANGAGEMSAYIETGIECPPPKRREFGSSIFEEIAKDMEVGDSVVFPNIQRATYLKVYLKRVWGEETKTPIRKTPDGGFRIWRY